MIFMDAPEENNLRRMWHDALARYEKLEMGRRKVELNSIIRPILDTLQADSTIEALEARYRAGLEWCVEIAKTGYPTTPSLWKIESTADVAFALRYRQITGEAP